MQGRLLTFSLFIQNSSLWQKLCRTSWTCHLSSSSTTVNSLWKVWDSLVGCPAICHLYMAEPGPTHNPLIPIIRAFPPTPPYRGFVGCCREAGFCCEKLWAGRRPR